MLLLGPYCFCPLLCPSLHEMFSDVSFLVFPILLFSSFSLYYSLRQAFLFLLAILWELCIQMGISSFSPLPFPSLLFSAICKAFSDNHFAFFAFLFLGDGLDHFFLYNVTNLCPYFCRHSISSSPLNLFLTSTV